MRDELSEAIFIDELEDSEWLEHETLLNAHNALNQLSRRSHKRKVTSQKSKQTREWQ